MKIDSQYSEEAVMNTYERLVVVKDEEGKKFVCTLDNECNDSACALDSNRIIPTQLEELTEHERSSCVRFFPESGDCPLC